jgi:hypothetical protein
MVSIVKIKWWAYEMEMRAHIAFLLRQIPKKKPDLRFCHIHLFELVVNYLKSRKQLERAIDIQQKKGKEHLLNALKGPLSADKTAGEFTRQAPPEQNDLVLLSGVGNAYLFLLVVDGSERL